MNSKEKNIDQSHKNDLGFELPEDYFLKSKNEILSKVSKKETKIISFYKSKMIWFAAAGISLILALTVYKQQVNTSIINIPNIVSDTLNTNKMFDLATDYIFEDDVLIASLFVSDVNLKNFLNNAFVEGVVEDEYLDDYIVDQLMDDDILY